MNVEHFANFYADCHHIPDLTIVDRAYYRAGKRVLFCAFDLSDRTHWLTDGKYFFQATRSLVGARLSCSESESLHILNDDGSVSAIEWVSEKVE